MAKEEVTALSEEAQLVVDRFKIAESWRRPLQDDWNRFYKLYRSQQDETESPWRSNLFIPYCFSTIETILPRLVTNRPRFEFVPRGPEDKERASLVDELMKYQWDYTNMDLTLVKWVKEALIYGTSILKVPWVFDKKNDGPLPEVVDLFDFFIDPSATSIKLAKYVIHRTKRSKKYLKDMQSLGIYKNIDKVIGGTSIEDSKSERYANVGLSTPMKDKKDDEVEILEYWEDDKVITLADRKEVIRNGKNPYSCGKPFIALIDQLVPHEFYGLGEIDQIESLQYELNDWRNHRMDSKTLTLNPMWWVPVGYDLDDFIAEPGAVFTGPQPPEVVDVRADKQSDYREEEIIKGDIQTTTGVSDYSRGIESSPGISNDTATGISLIQEAANMRFRMKVMLIEEMGIKELGLMMLKLNQQFMSEKKVIRITGDEGYEWKTITPDDIKGEYDIMVETGSSQPMNESLRRKTALDLLSLFAGDPDLSEEGRIDLKKSVMEAHGIRNPDKYFNKPMEGMMPASPVSPEGQLPGQPQPAGQPNPDEIRRALAGLGGPSANKRG